MPNKVYPSPRAALQGVLFDGMTIMSGGFGLSGNPESLIPVIRDSGVEEPDYHFQQLRRRWIWSVDVAR